MGDNISPEDRLLRLIKGDKRPSSANKPIIREYPVSRELKQESKFSFQKIYSNYLTWINFKNIIILFIILSFTYLIASFAYSGFNLEKFKLLNIQLQKLEVFPAEPREKKPLEFYLESLKRPIFLVNSVKDSAEAVKISSVNREEDLKDIIVVGIISGENPQAVVEYKAARKTFYVSESQFIGEYEVKKIEEGRIILELDGKKYELYI